MLMQILLPEEILWNLQSCGHWHLQFCDYSVHILLKVNAYWAFFRVTENQALSCIIFFSASNGLYTLLTSGSAACIVIHKSNISKEEIAGM